MRLVLLLFVLLTNFVIFGQKNQIDSLLKVFNQSKSDTSKVGLLNQLFDSYYGYNNDTLKYICNKTIDICNKNLEKKLTKREKYIFLKGKADAFNNHAFYLYDEEKIEESNGLFFKSLKIRQAINDQEGVSSSYNNIAYNYEFLGKTKEALYYYFKSLKIREKTKDKKGMAATLNNIALVYSSNNELEKALKYTLRSVQYRKETGDKKGLSTGFNNLGLIYFRMQNTDEAISNFEKALVIRRELQNYAMISTSLSNLAFIYSSLNRFDESEKLYLEALEIAKKVDDFDNIIHNLMCLAKLKLTTNKLNESLAYAKKMSSLIPANNENIKRRGVIYSLFAEIYEKSGDYKNALSYFKKAEIVEDSLNNDDNKKAIVESQIQYEYDKKASNDSIAFAKETLLKNAQLETKKKQQYFLIVIAIIILVFAFVIFNRFKVSKKQNLVITQQKVAVEDAHEKLEEKSKEVKDSITYAKRIQSAILPSLKFVKSNFNQSFIYYKPKDIVAGDFYWFETIEDTMFFAVADCTGHGVPGAMVSVVCHNALNRSIKEFNLKKPNEILDKAREIVISEFEKSEEEVKDGMDISLCVLDKNSNDLFWSGAHNPLWIVRDSKLLEFKADKQPIGVFLASKPFTQNHIKLDINDCIYLFTDGFQDQFGGEKGKKYKISQLRSLVLDASKLPFDLQKEKFNSAFENWQGEFEQIDDVCLLGIKIEK